MGYWSVINKEINRDLSYYESMRRLNKARVILKHDGIIPSPDIINEVKYNTKSFLEENYLKIFEVDFEGLSLTDLIQCEKCKVNLVIAKEELDNNQFDASRLSLAKAFEYLIKDYEDRKTNKWGRSPFYFVGDFTFDSAFYMDLQNRKLGNFIDKVGNSFDRVRDALKIMSFGIDYRKYVRFQYYLPWVSIWQNDEVKNGPIPDTVFTQDDFDFCFDFVIESALGLQSFDFDIVDNNNNSLADFFG